MRDLESIIAMNTKREINIPFSGFLSSKKLFLKLAADYLPMSNERHHVCDTWGAAIGLAFDVGAVCYVRGVDDCGLGYMPGVFGPEAMEDIHRAIELQNLNDEQLQRFAYYINRVLCMLKQHGKDY